MIEIYPDMYHDTVSLSVSSRLSCALPWCCFGLSKTRVSPDVFSQDSPSKVFIAETSQLEGIPCHECYSVLLGSTQLSLLVSTLLPVLSSRLEIWSSRGICARTSLVV